MSGARTDSGSVSPASRVAAGRGWRGRSLALDDGEGDVEGGAFAQGAVAADLAIVLEDDLLGVGEAEGADHGIGSIGQNLDPNGAAGLPVGGKAYQRPGAIATHLPLTAVNIKHSHANVSNFRRKNQDQAILLDL